MKIARLGTALMAGALMLAVAVPAEAATTTISIVGVTSGFSPATVSRPEGTTFAWHNSDSIRHTSTQDAGLWDTSNINAGATSSITLPSAGAYPYHCSIHASMTGTVRIPIKVSATSGSTTDAFTITLATTNASGSLVYDVQKRIGSGTWKAFKTGITAKSVTFGPAAAGTYSFRSRLRDTSGANKFSGYSPKKTITVS
jgi:plastocyanin